MDESADAAAAEIARQLAPYDLSGLVVFISPDYDVPTFASEIARRFGVTPVVGCTTAGEITPEGWSEGAAVAIGFLRRHFVFLARPILELSNFHVEAGRELTKQLRAELSALRPGFAGKGVFGILLVDGMCRREEAVVSALQMALDEIPIVGGSAGDGLKFERTFVIHGGKAHTDAAVLTLMATDLPFKMFRNDNYEPTPVKMVVTEANSELRIVKELNAEPAAKEYARVCGILDATLDAFSFASHPVLVRVGGEYFVRSIQRVNPDGSLSFFCAIDEGLVFTAAKRLDPMESLRRLSAGSRTNSARSISISASISFSDASRRRASSWRSRCRSSIAPSGWSASTPTASSSPRCTSTRPSPTWRSATAGAGAVTETPGQAEEIKREIAKLQKINAKLISRVERSYDQSPNAYALFETAIGLDNPVRRRTQEVQQALRSVEQANQDLMRAKQQAEAANLLKSSVLTSISHDLLQPLNAARLALSALTSYDIGGSLRASSIRRTAAWRR